MCKTDRQSSCVLKQVNRGTGQDRVGLGRVRNKVAHGQTQSHLHVACYKSQLPNLNSKALGLRTTIYIWTRLHINGNVLFTPPSEKRGSKQF